MDQQPMKVGCEAGLTSSICLSVSMTRLLKSTPKDTSIYKCSPEEILPKSFTTYLQHWDENEVIKELGEA